jgi:hypothetical protein
VTAAASLATSVTSQHVEVYGGAELAYHFKIFHAFLQGQGIGLPKCPPEEEALNFCARGFRFAAGVRFDFDVGQGGLLIGTGSGTVEPGWMVGAQLGLDYDETVRRMHGDGIEAAQAWWERRFEAMARGWAAWRSAAAVWEDEAEAMRRARPNRPVFLAGLLGPGASDTSPWLDAMLEEEAGSAYALEAAPTTAPAPAASLGPSSSPAATRAKPAHGRKPSQRSLFAETNTRAALQRQLAREPRFILPSGLPAMTEDEWNRIDWRTERERLAEEEQQKWRASPQLPPMEKAVLNSVLTAPYRAGLALLVRILAKWTAHSG